MKHLYVIKFFLFTVSITGVVANSVDSIYAYMFNKPLFIHFYPVKKRLSKQQKKYLQEHISFYKKLDDIHKIYFEHRLVNFMRTYDFISRDGLKITPEVKVSIASSYVKLTFGMRRYLTSVFDKIIVYPSIFYSTLGKQYHKGEFNPMFKAVVFSWEDFLLGDTIENDNLNLGIHEFTHALTFHGKKRQDVNATVFYETYMEITDFLTKEDRVEAVKQTNYFREYALTSKLEFVAVVMEHFFETPKALQQQFPKLYSKIETMLNYKSILNSQLS